MKLYRAKIIATHEFDGLVHDSFHLSLDGAYCAIAQALSEVNIKEEDPEWRRCFRSSVLTINVEP